MTKRDSHKVFENPRGGQITPEAMRRSVSPRSSGSGEVHQSPRRVQGEGEYVDSSERGLVSARSGHRSPVPRFDLSPRGVGGRGLYYGEQVPLSGGTMQGRGDIPHRVVSSSDGIEIENGSTARQEQRVAEQEGQYAQQVVRPSEHQMDVDHYSDNTHQVMSPDGQDHQLEQEHGSQQ